MLRFQRPAGFYREEVWEVATPGWRLERRGEYQLLVADADGAASQVVVEFPEHTEQLDKAYELFGKFTDGSVAIYTGHLYVTAEEDATDTLRRIELVPRDGEHLVVRGKLARRRTCGTGSCTPTTTVPTAGCTRAAPTPSPSWRCCAVAPSTPRGWPSAAARR